MYKDNYDETEQKQLKDDCTMSPLYIHQRSQSCSTYSPFINWSSQITNLHA